MDRRDPDTEHLRVLETLLGPYVLGALEPEEDREVERHLEECPACRAEERALRETHERLAGVAIANAAAPPRLKERTLAALPPRNGDEAAAHAGGTLRSPRRLHITVAASLLLLTALALVAYYSFGLSGSPTEAIALSPTAVAPAASGELEVRVSEAGTEANLEVWGLPETGPNEYYELWFGREEGRVSAGTFTVDGEGRGQLSATCPYVKGGYRRVGVTLERFPEEPRREGAKVVLGGELRGA